MFFAFWIPEINPWLAHGHGHTKNWRSPEAQAWLEITNGKPSLCLVVSQEMRNVFGALFAELEVKFKYPLYSCVLQSSFHHYPWYGHPPVLCYHIFNTPDVGSGAASARFGAALEVDNLCSPRLEFLHPVIHSRLAQSLSPKALSQTCYGQGITPVQLGCKPDAHMLR